MFTTILIEDGLLIEQKFSDTLTTEEYLKEYTTTTLMIRYLGVGEGIQYIFTSTTCIIVVRVK